MNEPKGWPTCPHCGFPIEPDHQVLHDCKAPAPEPIAEMEPAFQTVYPADWKGQMPIIFKREERKGNWMQTFTGRQFWPLDPRPEEIYIEDISHALSLYCRFGGHCKRFYPVGEHSLFVMNLVPEKDKLHALLHDAPEAYLGDMINPLKRTMPEYQRAEHAVWLAVCERFGISPCLPASVRIADRIAVMTERRDICSPPPADWGPGFEDVPPAVATIPPFRMPYRTEDDFLMAFFRLTKNKI